MTASRMPLVGKVPLIGAIVLIVTISIYLLHDQVDLQSATASFCQSQSSEAYYFDVDTDDAMRLLPHMFTPTGISDDKGLFSTGEEPGSLDRLIVVAHYHEDLDWLKDVPTPWRVIDKEDSRNPDFVNSNRMTEPSAYLYFLIKYYDSLPNHVAFVHGHGQPEVMRGEYDGRAEGSVWAGSGYRSINAGIISSSANTRQRQEGGPLLWFGDARDKPVMGPDDALEVIDQVADDFVLGFYELWEFLERDIEHGGMGFVLPHIITTKCCSTFVIDRASVLRIPRNMLVRLLDWLENGWAHKSVGNAMEYTWVLLFNQARWLQRNVELDVLKS